MLSKITTVNIDLSIKLRVKIDVYRYYGYIIHTRWYVYEIYKYDVIRDVCRLEGVRKYRGSPTTVRTGRGYIGGARRLRGLHADGSYG